ncbi:MAG: peptidoglycan DD-metalloendopeptidase family protein [Cycloclasticus sp.]
MNNRDIFTAFCGMLFVLSLVSCGSPQIHAPVFNNNKIKGSSATVHIVRLGDTLYSIAWQRSKDFRDLAKWNNISQPYTIYKGQKLTLVAVKKTVKTSSYYPKQKIRKTVKKQAVTKVTSRNKSPKLKLSWQWPIKVKKLEKGSVQSGVVLVGKPGELVRSSEGGKVVYAGSGLKGYGNLLIIMHNNEFLTAYGYNKRLLVKEGSVVEKGQAIAEIGIDNKKRRILFFEMRRHGKSISVVKYMPQFRR